MGLDMYLKAKIHVGGYEWSDSAEKELFNALIHTVSAEEMVDKDSPTAELSINVGYWRKANAIHGWFVRNVQDNEDECREHYVSREQLEKLLADCVEVMNNNDKAMELLPPTPGFFFGQYELDEWYWGSIRETASLVGKLLKTMPTGWDFYYRSSW